MVDQLVEEKDKYRNALNEVIAIQRKYYHLHQELLQLKEYDITFSDFECFARNFSSIEWREIKSAKAEIERLDKVIRKYERSDEKKEFDILLSTLSLNGEYFAEAIGNIKEDVAKTGFDRHSNFFRKINNIRRNFRLGNVRRKLPRKLRTYP
jgi:hypothetical protein